ncbi:MAG: NifU family protein [Humibacillus sp.]|nr:NifU family protein [Humibacillus sp.]MDN5775335.1 NifU family protein [Humibacillus sp.]
MAPVQANVPALVPLHPEPVDGDALSMRWIVPPDVLGFVGATARLPDQLQSLLDDGPIETLMVEPAAVVVRLRGAFSWRRNGAAVRTALQAALAVPDEWLPAQLSTSDDVLRMAVVEVIDGDVGVYVRSHGGQIELVDVHDGDVRVRMNGACTHCPASRVTLGDRFENAVRARYPQLRSVTSVGSGGSTGSVPDAAAPPVEGRRRLPLVFSRRS